MLRVQLSTEKLYLQLFDLFCEEMRHLRPIKPMTVNQWLENR